MARAPPRAPGGWNWGGGRGPQWAPPRVRQGLRSGQAAGAAAASPPGSAHLGLQPGSRVAQQPTPTGTSGRPPSPHSRLPLGITAPRPPARPPERAADLETQPGRMGPTASWNEASGKATRPGQSRPPPGSCAPSSDPHSWHLPATLGSRFLWANLTPCRASQGPPAPPGPRHVGFQGGSSEGRWTAGSVCSGTVLESGKRG